MALGLGDQLVGVSHECNYPPEVRGKPVMVRTSIESDSSSSAEIERQVRAAAEGGQDLYEVDAVRLAAISPDLIITQDLCEVCAITPGKLTAVLQKLPKPPQVLSLKAKTLEDVFAEILQIGNTVGRAESAEELVRRLRRRLTTLNEQIGNRSRPRVVCLEWLDPPYIASHWVPEMIALAGGLDLLGQVGAFSHPIKWEEVEAAEPEVLVLAPCSFSVERTLRELPVLRDVLRWDRLTAFRFSRIFAVDAAAYFSRSGPRLVDGIELLAQLFHPELFGLNVPPGAQQVTIPTSTVPAVGAPNFR